MKEVIIIIFVIIIVVVMGDITQNYLKETSDEILTKLTNLKTEIKEIKENKNTRLIVESVKNILLADQ